MLFNHVLVTKCAVLKVPTPTIRYARKNAPSFMAFEVFKNVYTLGTTTIHRHDASIVLLTVRT
jgi:hypothetical protein